METAQEQALADCLAAAADFVADLAACLGRLAASQHRPTRRHVGRRVAVVGPQQLRARRGLYGRPAPAPVPFAARARLHMAGTQRRATPRKEELKTCP
ncbi:MAG: hypothetical protein CMF19_07330 [Idiomarinaceae bacterium]|nr:hypothetical protein [Idiomarinaceae bacterium]